MVQLGRISEIQPGIYSTTIDQCTTDILPSILRPDVPYIWVVGHWPGNFQWWDARLPLTRGGASHLLRVRDVEFDLQLDYDCFLSLLSEFRHSGAIVHQMAAPVPDGLTYRRLPDKSRYGILRDNGWVLEFQLPVPGDYAAVTTTDRSWLETILTRPGVAPGLIG